MGTADGATGLSSTPMKVGEFDSLLDFGFTGPETSDLAGAAKAGLPGKSRILQANTFPYSETRDYLLPDAVTTQAYGETFAVAGGRPERDPSDLEFTLAAGVLPPGMSLDLGGTVSGTSPLRFPDNSLVGGVARFLVRMRDKPTGTVIFFSHRINVLVDVSDPSLSPAEVALGNQRNTATLNEP